MLILPLAVIVGLFVGRIRGGSCRSLAELRLQRSAVVLGAVAAQAALEFPGVRSWPSDVKFVIVVISYLVVGWWIFENSRAFSGAKRRGLVLVGIGWALNLLAIVPNRGMPVSPSALKRAGIAQSTSVGLGHMSKHVALHHGTVLGALGDVIPLSWFRSVVSAGDIVMAVGIACLVAAAMRARAPQDSAIPTSEPLVTSHAGSES